MIAETTQPGPTQLPVADLIFGTTAGMQQVRMTLETALHDDLPVLIEGESGTGKEIAARYLHLGSRRAAGPFVRVNCGAVPASLLEVEMFGEVSQASGKAGNGSIGGNGTLFLDEIAEMNPGLQRKVVEALRNRHCGSDGAGLMNARIVCASSVDLQTTAFPEGTFAGLPDHFGHRVRLLPLRERKQDIPQLCEYLIEKFAQNFGRPAPRLSASVLRSFQGWNWLGNIRELENWIARIVIFGTEEAIGPEFRLQMASGEGVPVRHRALGMFASRVRRRRGRT